MAPASFVLAAVAAIVDHVQSPESNAGRHAEGGGEGLTDRGRPLHQVSVHPLSHPYSEQRPSSFAALLLSLSIKGLVHSQSLFNHLLDFLDA